MNKEELAEILEKHLEWLYGEGDGERAYLSGAYLSGADLRNANLSRANLRSADLSRANLRSANLRSADLSRAYLRSAGLSGANLSRADLRSANLSRADLRSADLSRAYLIDANLSRADLSGAYLSGAYLSGADLNGTCLNPNLIEFQRAFCRQCPPLATGGRIVFRTAKSQHVGSTEYKPGHTYTAPILSFDCATDCHPGIYAATLEWMKENYPDEELVVCYVRDGDWVISGKGAIRCKKLRVLRYYEED